MSWKPKLMPVGALAALIRFSACVALVDAFV